jgi:hypothetical protein
MNKKGKRVKDDKNTTWTDGKNLALVLFYLSNRHT